MREQKISVRALVEFILRSGDIDNRTETGSDPDAMLKGGRIHRKIQKSMPPTYRAEVPVRAVYTEEDLCLTVEGRADGIDRREESLTVDEIKGVYADVNRFTEPRKLHLAQAKCYAAMLAKNGECGRDGEICCQITYCSMETEEIRRFRESFRCEDLLLWMEQLTGAYFRWARFLSVHREERNRTAAEAPFPYDYRPGQKAVAVDVFRAIRRERNLFIQAPTGLGKTLSVIYPSVKAMAEGLTERIFYLTAKTVTRTVAENTFRLLAERGLAFLTCSVTAKEKACANPVFDCNPDACPRAKGHFNRVNDAVFDIITHETVISSDLLRSYAERHRVCPYEFSLDVSLWCDAVAADYNYAFDPRVHLRRFFSEGAEKNAVFLVDEAHNLPDRASEMYSAVLKKEDVLALKQLVKPYGKRLNGALDRLNKTLLSLRRSLEQYPAVGGGAGSREARLLPDINFLLIPLERAFSELSRLLEEKHSFPERKDVMPYFFGLRTFFNTAELLDARYRIYCAAGEDGHLLLKLLCIDPSENLKEYLSYARSTVFFSATLLPVNYYEELLTGNTEEYAVYAESPFPRENRLLMAADDVSTRYVRRTQEEYRKIAACIRSAVSARPGNYLVFFPSYEYLNAIRRELEKGGLPLLTQEQEMTEEDRKHFLRHFVETEGAGSIGLCVMGGVFSEGIDLKEEQLIGVIVVGTGLPAVNTESEIRKAYFDAQGKDGFAYAYRYPGMNKVLQSAGRLIRSDRDRGVILLLDDRFLRRECRSLFPREWSDCIRVRSGSAEQAIRNFWNGNC